MVTEVATNNGISRASRFEPLSGARAERWSRFGGWSETYFPDVVGLRFEEVRVDYARMRLPYRPELRQPAGMIHGGAIATLIDTVVVPALGSAFDEVPFMVTIDLQIRFLGAARDGDLIGEGWVTRRGNSISFCQAEVRRAADDEVVAEGWMVYKVSAQRPPSAAPGNG
jgi:uncharacterized protein (TIGR00369 family)